LNIVNFLKNENDSFLATGSTGKIANGQVTSARREKTTPVYEIISWLPLKSIALSSLPSKFLNLPHYHLFINFDPLIAIAVI
jgi:hypothetical protein